ncbi:hypothetical protein FRC06_002911 [Ceratobasidium sp. 370]|nr:hypothetical protein FRC06_002911 [Ceratobasidium sp. 370]
MSAVSPAPRPHAHTSLGAPSSSLRSRIPQPTSPARVPTRPQRSPSRADNVLGIQLARSRSTSPRPAPLNRASPPARNRESLVASEDSFGQTVFLNRLPPRTSSLSRPPTRLEVPSSPDDPLFYHPPQPTFPLPHSRSALHQRESMVTQSSNLTTSSIYPPSSSSQTGPDSPPSPSTPSAHSSVDPAHTPGFAVDADDVSYRLRLLVRNNYFLPPAHSKPNHSELSLLSANANQPPVKTPSPTFRDLFRVRPRTPSRAGPESPKIAKAPTTASPVVRPPVPARTSTCPTPLSTAPSMREKERRGRVLVIRERLDDLVTAATAAEIDMRAREDDRRRREPPNAKPNPAAAAVDLIDPTETVDLPSYMFPVQSSLTPFGGLGVDNSVGAAALADALPPRTEDVEDEAWRKALLHKAVGLSMLSIPEPTPTPSQRSASTSTRSPASLHTSSASGSGSKPGSALPSPNPAIGRSIISGSRLTNLTPVSPLKSSGIRSPGFATRSPSAKTRELPIGSGSSPSSSSPGKQPNPSLPPPPRARTASKNSLSPRPSQGVEKPSMLPVPKHTVRRALSTPMLAQKVGTAAAASAGGTPPVPNLLSVQSPGKERLKPGPSTGQRSVTMSALRANSGSRAPTPSGIARAMTPVGRVGAHPTDRATTPSRAPTPSPALLVETPEGQTVLPTRDTITSLTSGSNYSDDDEIVAVDDDDEDEIIAVDDDDNEPPEQDAGQEYVDLPEENEDDMRAPSRAGVMLRPDSRMTNATVVRPSFHESRTASRVSHTMSAFGGLDMTDPERARSLSPPVGPSSQRNSIVMPPKRSSTLMSEVVPPTPPPNGSTPPATSQSPPLNVRRSQVVAPLTLQPPSSFASTVASLRSAPPPASTDFFDALYARSLASGGLGSDSDSEETEPPVPIFVQPRARAVSTTSVSTSRSKASRILGFDVGSIGGPQGTVMQFPSSSNPYLATDPNPYQALDPRKPVTNTPPASQTKFRALNLLRPATSMGLRSSGRKSPHLIQHPAIRAGMSGSLHGHESVRSGAASIRSEASTVGGRAARSEESIVSTRRHPPDPSLARLDGLYAMHIEAERDQMKRITNAASSKRS